jgi:hypothetical protein
MNNVSLPEHQYAFVRNKFLRNGKPPHDMSECIIFGAESMPGYAMGFHILREDGVMYAQVPIHALCHRQDAALKEQAGDLQAWDCFGFAMTVAQFDYLSQLRFTHRSGLQGEYVCTFDFIRNGFSNYPEQHKHLHLLMMDDGNYMLQPNTTLRAEDKSFTTKLFDWKQPPDIEANEATWSCEA